MRKKLFFVMILMLFISIVAEVFVFNYKHWVSLKGEAISMDSLVLGNSYKDNGDGTYTMVEGQDASIYIENLNEPLISSYIRIEELNRVEGETNKVQVWQTVTDESNYYGYELPPIEIWADEERSFYHIYHLYGNCTGIRILPNLSRDTVVTVDIALNPTIPLFLSWFRVGIMFGVLCLFYVFRPGSCLYKVCFTEMKWGQKLIFSAMLLLLHVGVFGILIDMNPAFTWGIPEHHRQYQKLAEAMAEGNFALLENPPQSLLEMDNPYDYAYRDAVVAGRGESYAWDTAYYEGKYYVYFGVIPVMIFYLPYYLLTGTHISNYMVILIGAIMFVVGLLACMWELAHKWFRKLSIGIWLLTTELVLLGSGILYLTKRPDLYNIPIVMGLAFGMIGFACFLKADREETISLRWLALGSFFTALIAGCRPQMILFAVLPVILFRSRLFSRPFYQSKMGKQAVAMVVLPLVIVGGFLMFYNFGRFGSVTDFGANYNLTTNDMRHRGWVWGRIPLGLFVYFLQPMKFTTQFPFVEMIYTGSQYVGTTIQEYTAGGVFMTHFFAMFGLSPFLFKRYIKAENKTPWLVTVACMIVAGVIAVADIEMAGILWRYQSDFLIFIMIGAVLSCWMISCHKRINGTALQRLVICAVLFCVLGEFLFQAGTFFLDTSCSLKEMRPDLYCHAKYLFGFWL